VAAFAENAGGSTDRQHNAIATIAPTRVLGERGHLCTLVLTELAFPDWVTTGPRRCLVRSLREYPERSCLAAVGPACAICQDVRAGRCKVHHRAIGRVPFSFPRGAEE